MGANTSDERKIRVAMRMLRARRDGIKGDQLLKDLAGSAPNVMKRITSRWEKK